MTHVLLDKVLLILRKVHMSYIHDPYTVRSHAIRLNKIPYGLFDPGQMP